MKKVRSAAVVRFFERRIVEFEKQSAAHERPAWIIPNIKSVQLEGMKKVEPQFVRDEEGRLLRDNGCIRERWGRFFLSLLNDKFDMLDPDIPKRLPQQSVASALKIEPTEESCRNNEDNGKCESNGAGRLSRGTAKTRTSTRSDHLTGAPPTYHPHLARGKRRTAMERRGNYHTPQ